MLHTVLYAIPGRAAHNVFVNECNQEGKDELPEACVDAAAVQATAHEYQFDS